MSRATIVIPGWGETAASMARLRRVLANLSDYPVVTPRYSRLAVPTAARAMAARLATLQQVADSYDGPVTLVSHSMGALDAVAAARANPLKFPRLVLASPAGLTNPTSPYRAAGRFAAKTLHDTFGQWRVATGFIARNPLLALAEGRAVSRADLRPLLRDLADSGVHIHIVAAKGDRLFAIEQLRELVIKPHDNIQFIELDGTHDSVHLSPEQYEEMWRSVLS